MATLQLRAGQNPVVFLGSSEVTLTSLPTAFKNAIVKVLAVNPSGAGYASGASPFSFGVTSFKPNTDGTLAGYVIITNSAVQVDAALFSPIPAPTLASFSSSTVSPGDTLTLTGTNLAPPAYVLIGGISALITGTATATSVKAIVPLSATSGAVVVVTAGGYAVKTGLTVAASGSSKLSTPANLRQTSATATSNTMSWDAVPNASGYELQNGVTTIYNGPDITYTENSLASGTAYPYKVRAIGVGVYGTSDFSAVVSATPTSISSEINAINVGDSITNGSPNGTGTDPESAPGDFAVQRIISPGVKLNKQAYPGQNLRYVLDSKKQAILDAIVPGKRNILSFAFGANDMNSRTRAQRRADFTEAATWASGITGIEGVLFVPTLDRGDTGTDGYGYNLADDGISRTDFWPAAQEHNTWIAANLPAISSKVKVASLKNVRSLLGQQGWFNDLAFCSTDRIHPNIRGSKLLGQLVLAEGLALYGGVTLAYLSGPQTIVYESMNSNAAYVNGYMTKVASDVFWDTNIRGNILITQLGPGQKVVAEFDEVRAGHESVMFGATGAPIALSGFAFIDLANYFQPTEFNLYQSGGKVFPDNGPRPTGKPRIEITATSTSYFFGSETTARYTNTGATQFPLYIGGSLGKTNSGGDLPSEMPPCVVTGPNLVSII